MRGTKKRELRHPARDAMAANLYITEQIHTGQLTMMPILAITIQFVALTLIACGGRPEKYGGLPTDNRKPAIRGTPISTIFGRTYSLAHTSDAPDYDLLSFRIQNHPSWTVFDYINGNLSGKPALGVVGTDTNTSIAVSDRRVSGLLRAFRITLTTLINNLLSKNAECDESKPYQLVNNNNIFDFTFKNNYLITGSMANNALVAGQGPGNTLVWFESNYPTLFESAIKQNLVFKNESNLDFALKLSSPITDSSRFLTSTLESMAGTTISVTYANFFYHSFDIPVLSDLILDDEDTNSLRTVAVDYALNLITADKSLSWSYNQCLSLPFIGL
jgi:hypothetical protein